MTLRIQLLLVSLSLLGIPWAGVQFLKANEQALRSLQQQTLASTAQAIASGLNDRWEVLYSSYDRLTQPPSDNSLQVQNIAAAPILDGSFEDWLTPQWRQFGTERRPLHIALARTTSHFFVALRSFDNTKHYNATAAEQPQSGDRFVLTFWHQQKRQPWLVSTAAPGGFIDYLSRDTSTHTLQGHWRDVADGYQLELSLPIAAVGEHLGINYVDVDEGGESYRGNLELTHSNQPPALVLTPRSVDELLEKFKDSNVQISLVDRWGWELGRSSSARTPDQAGTHGLIQWLYRSILPTPLASPPPMKTDSGRLITGTAALALQSRPSQRLIHNGETLVAQFAAPITSRDHGIIGAVVIEQPREHYLLLTDSAFEALFYKGSLAILAVILALLGYAGFLSLRLRRLNAAVSRGLALNDTNGLRLNDEVSDLARQFHRLRGEQLRLEAYLRSLPRALAHEIRTPVAVITSTLDNIASAQTDAERSALVDRAKSGLSRLSKLLNAMNEATRLEASVGSEDYETIDLVILLTDLKEAYRSTFTEWSFDIDTDEGSASVRAVPELLAQALDKLIANATSFTAPGNTIYLVLRKRGMWWRLSVRNPGPTLPTTGEALFAPMQSIREQTAGDEQHIGLGLYMVSLIAQHHGGEPFAKSTDQPQGAEVGFSIAMS